MSLEITISDNGKYIIGKVDVPLTLDIAQQLAKEYVKIIKTTGIKKILNDVRSAPDTMGAIQGYEYAYSDVKLIELPKDIRAAIVADPDDTSHYFQETVACNAGYLVKVFHSYDDAVNWLLKDKI